MLTLAHYSRGSLVYAAQHGGAYHSATAARLSAYTAFHLRLLTRQPVLPRFSPAVGVPEESATGTASGATGGYLVLNGLVEVKEPVTKIVCEQGHILRRPSTIHVEVTTDSGRITCVRVGGSAVTVIRGTVAAEG